MRYRVNVPAAGLRAPGRPFIAALEPGRTSWTQVLDAVRLGPDNDVAEVTAVQVRAVVQRLVTAGQWQPGDPEVLVVFDAGYDLARLAFLLADLPVEVLGRLRSDRVFRLPVPPRTATTVGRPDKHGGEFCFADPGTWPEPDTVTFTETNRYGGASATAWDRLHPRLTRRAAWWSTTVVPVADQMIAIERPSLIVSFSVTSKSGNTCLNCS